ncbi:MAG TPA: DUF1800 domain-containing protein [Fimbriimonadaceae bacterium]|nr:DUF1800 domain-containing protein [Fimbriimonadaceae bacterium]
MSSAKSATPVRHTHVRGSVRSGALGLIAISALAVALGVPARSAQSPKRERATSHSTAADDRILHVLNRLAFGPRPDDVAKVKAIGLDRYIDQQLHPETIDDSALEQKLKAFPELQLSDAEIEAKYKDFVTADQASAKMRRELQKMASQKAGDTMTQTAAGQSTGTVTGTATPPPANQQTQQAKRGALQEMLAANPQMAQQFEEDRRQLAAAAQPIGLLHSEFTAAKLIRATESQRQLQEVLVDFWSNHFNIDIRKAPCGVLKVLDDRNVIRPHVFGKFRDLLEASAKSPAMLVYLDNFQSVADNLQLPNRNPRRPNNRFGNQGQFNGGQGQGLQNQNPAPNTQQAPKRRGPGLNENYAREIMELHTLGVNGGYTQQDVREVARCFTGWGIGNRDGARQRVNRYAEAGEFAFYPRLHDNGQKVVLGHVIPAGGGMEDAEMVLDILATHPATRRHVSYQMCQRLVCDDPPASLVQKCMDTWQKTAGDLREIVRTIITSDEFYSAAAMHKKIKSPFEYAISSVRALNGTIEPPALSAPAQIVREANGLIRPPQGGGFLDVNTNTLLGQIGTMGQPLFQYQAPTGFPEDSRKWVSSGALIARLNFSLALTQGRIRDVKLEDLAEDAGARMEPEAAIDRLSDRILHGAASATTRATLVSEAKNSTGASFSPATITALLLGSPEFQRR